MAEHLAALGLDPEVNKQARAEDPLLLQGKELESLETPPLSQASSPGMRASSSGSILYPLSLEGGNSDSQGASNQGILSEVVESPPVDEVAEVEGRKSSETVVGVAGKPPRVPPRRAPKTEGQEDGEEKKDEAAAAEETDATSEASNEFKDAIAGKGEEHVEEKKDE